MFHILSTKSFGQVYSVYEVEICWFHTEWRIVIIFTTFSIALRLQAFKSLLWPFLHNPCGDGNVGFYLFRLWSWFVSYFSVFFLSSACINVIILKLSDMRSYLDTWRHLFLSYQYVHRRSHFSRHDESKMFN